eukprot:4772236-Prymnesium_polylepis.3
MALWANSAPIGLAWATRSWPRDRLSLFGRMSRSTCRGVLDSHAERTAANSSRGLGRGAKPGDANDKEGVSLSAPQDSNGAKESR